MKDDNSSGVIVKLRIKWVRIKKRTPREAFTPEQLRGNCRVQAITEAGNGDSPSKWINSLFILCSTDGFIVGRLLSDSATAKALWAVEQTVNLAQLVLTENEVSNLQIFRWMLICKKLLFQTSSQMTRIRRRDKIPASQRLLARLCEIPSNSRTPAGTTDSILIVYDAVLLQLILINWHAGYL